MSDDPRDVRVAELEAEVLALSKERDQLKQDNADLLPEADATAWALNEMNAALTRAREAEIKVKTLERDVTILENRLASVLRERHAPRPVAPVEPVSEDTPQPLRQAPPSGLHGSMADVLGFPKDGR